MFSYNISIIGQPPCFIFEFLKRLVDGDLIHVTNKRYLTAGFFFFQDNGNESLGVRARAKASLRCTFAFPPEIHGSPYYKETNGSSGYGQTQRGRSTKVHGSGSGEPFIVFG
jgi:hypothetical protein